MMKPSELELEGSFGQKLEETYSQEKRERKGNPYHQDTTNRSGNVYDLGKWTFSCLFLDHWIAIFEWFVVRC